MNGMTRQQVCTKSFFLKVYSNRRDIFNLVCDTFFAEITGFTKDEALDLPLVETFIVPNLRKSVHEVMDNALRGQGTSNYELEFRTKDKEIRYLLGER